MSETMEAIKTLLDRLVGEDLDHLSDDVLGQDLIALETTSGVLEAERSRRLHRFNRLRGYAATDHTSASAFLIDRCRIAPGRASRLVAQASTLAEMPATAKALTDEKLSADQARHLIVAHDTNREIFSEHERILVDSVEGLGIADTGRALTYWRQLVNEPAFEKDAESLHEMRQVHLSKTFEGMGRLDGWLDPVSFEIVKTALDAATPPPAQGDSRTPAQRRADALVDIARLALDDGRLPASGGEKPHLTVMVSLDQLTGNGSGQAETIDGTIFARSDLHFLACDCSLTRLVMGSDSEPLDIGRKTRVIPPALRRAVIARDRHCQHSGCYRPAMWCDIDHILPWYLGGETKLSNLQLLCRYHHRLKHRRLRAGPNGPFGRPSRHESPDRDLPTHRHHVKDRHRGR